MSVKMSLLKTIIEALRCRSRVCFSTAASCVALTTACFPSVSDATNEPPAANAVAIPQPAKPFLADAAAGCLPKPDRLLDRAWATPEAGELLRRLRREYPADQDQIDVYLACWNFFNDDPFAAKERLRRLSRKVESVQPVYLQMLARDGDWRGVKTVAGMTNYTAAVRAAAYLKLQKRAIRSGRKDDAAIYARQREPLLETAAPATVAPEEVVGGKAAIEK
jgi:hypothetical protein